MCMGSGGGKSYNIIFIFSESRFIVHRIQLHTEAVLLKVKKQTYRFHIMYFNPGTLTLLNNVSINSINV